MQDFRIGDATVRLNAGDGQGSSFALIGNGKILAETTGTYGMKPLNETSPGTEQLSMMHACYLWAETALQISDRQTHQHRALSRC